MASADDIVGKWTYVASGSDSRFSEKQDFDMEKLNQKGTTLAIEKLGEGRYRNTVHGAKGMMTSSWVFDVNKLVSNTVPANPEMGFTEDLELTAETKYRVVDSNISEYQVKTTYSTGKTVEECWRICGNEIEATYVTEGVVGTAIYKSVKE